MEQLERLRIICKDAIAKEPSDPTEREKGYTIALQHVLKILEDQLPTTQDYSKINNMKLYTEEQVRQAIKMADKYHHVLDSEEAEIISVLEPIELPTDKEIKKLKIKNNRELEYISANEFIQHGAKWVIEQIKKQV